MNFQEIVRQQIMLWMKIVNDCRELGKLAESDEAQTVLNYWFSQLKGGN